MIWSGLIIGGAFLPSAFEAVVLSFFGVRAVKGPKETIEAFIILLLFLLGNPTFTGGTAKFLRYLIFFTGFITIVRTRKKAITPFSRYLIIFYLFELLFIFLFGKIPVLSALKLTIFTIVVFTLIEAFALTRMLKPYWFKVINSFFLFSVFGSLIFLMIGLGFERNNTGFQGVFAHPQTFGPLMAVITAWFTGFWLSTKKPPSLMLFLVGICFVFIYMSLSRTAMGAILLGGGLAYLLSITKKTKIPNHKRIYGLTVMVIIGLLISLIFNPSQIENIALSFIQKREANTTDVSELFEQSRGFLVEASLENFAENPLFGIGLGVPTDYQYIDISKYQSIAGIPISASVEKGFLPAAVLEEMGIIGASLTIILLFLIFKKIRTEFSFMAIWIAFSALLINAGEAVLFSVGGLGLFVWFIISMNYNLDLLKGQKILFKRRNASKKINLKVIRS